MNAPQRRVKIICLRCRTSLCPFFASLRLIFFLPPNDTLQGFFFDWNPPGTTVPIPVTRTGFPVFFFRGFVCLLIGEQQSNAIRCTSPGNVGRREQGGFKHSLVVKGFH